MIPRGKVRRVRREIKTLDCYLLPSVPAERGNSSGVATLRARVDRLDRTIAALGQAAAESISEDDDAPALAQGLLELADHVADIRARLARIEGNK
jgi:hypothetical protein